jgi:hypothetical protein
MTSVLLVSRFLGKITGRKTRDDGKNAFNVVLDELATHSFTFLGTSLKYESPRVPTVRAAPATTENEDAEEEEEKEETEKIW